MRSLSQPPPQWRWHVNYPSFDAVDPGNYRRVTTQAQSHLSCHGCCRLSHVFDPEPPARFAATSPTNTESSIQEHEIYSRSSRRSQFHHHTERSIGAAERAGGQDDALLAGVLEGCAGEIGEKRSIG